MKPKTFMFIAGEASGDLLAAELVEALKKKFVEIRPPPTEEVQPLRNTGLAPRFFGAGGPRMGAAGVELAFDMTQHSVIGLSDSLKSYFKFRRLFKQLFKLALDRQPDVIVCVDFSVFNHRFAHAIKNYVRKHRDWFHPWNPKIVKYVSPQVWASREGRAYQMAKDFGLLLSIFPFEKDWYAARVPELRVEFVGHPMVGRFVSEERVTRAPGSENLGTRVARPSEVLLLPGSRENELKRHLPVMIDSAKRISVGIKGIKFIMVVSHEQLVETLWWPFASRAGLKINLGGTPTPKDVEFCASKIGFDLRVQVGNLSEALMQTTVAIASTGTVTMECAYFGVPTVALYKTSWSTYQIGKRIVKVKWLAMPNILAGEEIFPEFIQNDATPENISRVALEFLNSEERRNNVKVKLAKVVARLGAPGASERAADAIVKLLDEKAF